MWASGALGSIPASATATSRRARDSTSAAQFVSATADHDNVAFFLMQDCSPFPESTMLIAVSGKATVQSVRGPIDGDGRDTRPGRYAAQESPVVTRHTSQA